MTPESIEIAAIVDQFTEPERECMRDSIAEIAQAWLARYRAPHQLGFKHFAEPGSNLIIGPWKRRDALRKQAKRAPRKPPSPGDSAKPGA